LNITKISSKEATSISCKKNENEVEIGIETETELLSSMSTVLQMRRLLAGDTTIDRRRWPDRSDRVQSLRALHASCLVYPARRRQARLDQFKSWGCTAIDLDFDLAQVQTEQYAMLLPTTSHIFALEEGEKSGHAMQLQSALERLEKDEALLTDLIKGPHLTESCVT
jgi:hypothetical protein